MRIITFFIGAILLFSGCDEGKNPDPQSFTIEPGNMMLATNEGNFRSGNATASLYHFIRNEWLDDGFKTFNNRSLGDVCHSATFWNGNVFLVVNNSGKIEVVNPNTFVSAQTISGFVSPRYLLPVSPTKAYVTDIYANKVYIVSGFPLSITGEIPLHGWAEEMVLENGKVWVVNKSRPVVHIIDAQTDVLTDSMLLPAIPTSIAKGKGGGLWIGQQAIGAERPRILFVAAGAKSILNSVESPYSMSPPDRFVSSVTGDSVFFINGNPSMLVNHNMVFTWTTFVAPTGNWYGLGWDAKRQLLVASDAADYNQKSNIWMSYLGANYQTTRKGGIITSHFYFY